MRPIVFVPLLALSLVGACGRIGYDPLWEAGGGGAAGFGLGSGGSGTGGAAGVIGASGGGSGTGGTAGATGGGTGTGGAAGVSGAGGMGTGGAGGMSGSSGGVSGSSGGGMSGSKGGAAGTVGMGGVSGSSGGGSGGSGGTSGSAGTGAGGMAGGMAATGGAAGSGMVGGGGSSGALCPTDTFGGHTYAFCATTLTWANAQSDCAAKGMRLARIDDSAENSWVQSIAFAGIGSTSGMYWSWIGATDQAVLGDWRWTDGALFWVGPSNGAAQGGLYENWAAGGPSNNGPATDCGVIEHAGFWTDLPCSNLQRYVCEAY